MATQGRLRAVAKYDAKATKRLYIKLNKGTDADILHYLESISNKQGYIKELIRADMKKAEK